MKLAPNQSRCSTSGQELMAIFWSTSSFPAYCRRPAVNNFHRSLPTVHFSKNTLNERLLNYKMMINSTWIVISWQTKIIPSQNTISVEVYAIVYVPTHDFEDMVAVQENDVELHSMRSSPSAQQTQKTPLFYYFWFLWCNSSNKAAAPIKKTWD